MDDSLLPVLAYNKNTKLLEIYENHMSEDPPIWTGTRVDGSYIKYTKLFPGQGALSVLYEVPKPEPA